MQKKNFFISISCSSFNQALTKPTELIMLFYKMHLSLNMNGSFSENFGKTRVKFETRKNVCFLANNKHSFIKDVKSTV